ncbi:MAG: hypothetical protein L0H64_09625 [Pseudonocardia sp.]|nr:hypothetical protein [Pseudonocardia sp.]
MNHSSRRDPRTYLWDAIEASSHALDFSRELDDDIVWQVVTDKLPALHRVLRALLDELDR